MDYKGTDIYFEGPGTGGKLPDGEAYSKWRNIYVVCDSNKCGKGTGIGKCD